jgi:hypothetical protein
MSDENRVQQHTPADANARIERETKHNVFHAATFDEAATARRLDELEREWSIERVLEMNASALAFTGVVLAALVNRKWLWLSGAVMAFLFQHAVQGWCPPLPVFRRRGVRTRGEMDEEKFAIKALRGDFKTAAAEGDAAHRAQTAWNAVQR